MLLEEARRLHDLGMNITPIREGSKSPTIVWKQFQAEVIPWDTVCTALNAPEKGLGVVLGEVSQNLAVLDFDDANAYGRWSKSHADIATSLPTATSGRGFHVFIRLKRPYNGKLRVKGETESCGDILGTKKIAVLPPTKHPSGKARTWIIPLVELPPFINISDIGLESVSTDISTDILSQRTESIKRESFSSTAVSNVVSASNPNFTVYTKGSRHQSLLTVGGKLRNLGLNQPELESSLLSLNANRCSPPLNTEEVQSLAVYLSSCEVHSPKISNRDDERFCHSKPIQVHHETGSIGNEDNRYQSMFLSLPEYLRQTNAVESEWLLEGFLPVGYLGILGGTSKAGKSCFLTSLTLHVAEGRDFMGLATRQSKVLWVALEETETERRIALEAYDAEPDGLYITHEKIYIDSKEGIQALRYWVRKTGAQLIVIDPLYAANTAESLTDGNTARRVLQPLKDLCRDEQVTAILIHHLNKNTGGGMNRERFADSNQLLASVSMDILMDSSDLADGTRELRLQCRGRGEFANQTWIIKSDQLGDYQLIRNGKDVDRGSEATDALILGALDDGAILTAEEIGKKTLINLGTVRNRLTALKSSAKVETAEKDGRSFRYQVVA